MKKKLEEKSEEKKITKQYCITFSIYEDGSTNLNRVNNGMNLLELIGIVNVCKTELEGLFWGNTIPIDKIERQVMVDKK